MGHFSLMWNAYKQNICSGLSGLQQNGELVDMTLAADGHHVKVHQLVLSLVSPYIKELIASADCPHPVIFLNKISSPTLHSILEYVYTGEVVVSKESLIELMEAGKELRIKGLEDMNVDLMLDVQSQASVDLSKSRAFKKTKDISMNEVPVDDLHSQASITVSTEGKTISKCRPFIKTKDDVTVEDSKLNILKFRINPREANDEVFDEDSHLDDSADDNLLGVSGYNEMETDQEVTEVQLDKRKSDSKRKPDVSIQYTTSNRGVVQMILNRYMFTLEYTFKNEDIRKWRCVDYRKTKCPAIVFTKHGVVVKRIAAHSHTFHDKKILNKVHGQSVYTSIDAIEAIGKKTTHKRNERINTATLPTDTE